MNHPFDTGTRKIIKSRGLKQSYVAKESGYSAQEFSDMLNGRKLIKVCDIPKLANVLGVSVNELYAAGLEGGE